MKTLDEVIDDLKYTNFDDDGFAINLHCNEIVDVLNHLKEYRSEKQIWESDRKHYEDWIEQYKEARDKHQQAVKEMLKNPPLTWDELRTMVGKPVWVQWTVKGVWASGDWSLIQDADEDRIWFVDKDGETFDEEKEIHGNLWRAYRKEHTDA